MMKKTLALILVSFLIVVPFVFSFSLFDYIKGIFFRYNQISQPKPVVQVQPIVQTSTPQTTQTQSPVITAQNKDNFVHNDYSSFYTNNVIIILQGIDNTRMLNILSPINPSYFNGVKSITFIYSNPDANYGNVGAFYNSNDKSIIVYVYKFSDYFYTREVLHELKHHYCFINNHTWANVEESHQGCFLHTPLDDEFGFVK